MTRHRSRSSCSRPGAGCRDLGRLAAAASPAAVRAAARPAVPGPEVDRAVYDYAGILSPEAIAARPRRSIDAIEARTGLRGRRLHPGQRRATRRPRRPRRKARALMDQWGVGRAGLQRRAGHLLRHATRASSTARSSCTPAPASRRRSCRTRSASRSSRTTCSPTLAAGRLRRRPRRRAREGRTPPRRPSTPRTSSAPASSTPSSGSSAAPIVFMGLVGLGRSVNWRRFGKDPVYLDDPSVLMPGPAARPDRGIGRDDHGRRDVATGADDGHARPRLARAASPSATSPASCGRPQGRDRRRADRRATP